LWGAKVALKQETDYLIGAHVILEIVYLPLLGMIAKFDTLDITMLRWIAFIRVFNPKLKHIVGKDNPVANMLSRARYSSSQEDLDDAVCMATSSEKDYQQLEFCEDLYSGELVQIERYLSTLEKDPLWSADTFNRITKKSYLFMLRDAVIWRHARKKGHMLLRVIGTNKEKTEILRNLHDFDNGGHKKREATYERVKRLY
jgi:PHD/YefM family antitoxin component YafN of YafNO toxin-antitoxin module